jgi:signal peptidase I
MASVLRRKPTPKTDDEGHGSLLELVMIVVVALGLALTIQAFIVKPFRIPSGSMLPTLDVGERVLVDRVSYRFSEPSRGDIIVFKPPKGADQGGICGNPREPDDGHPCSTPTSQRSNQNFIKRVVAVPGDRLFLKDGRVYIDGKRQDEPFVDPEFDPNCDKCNLPRAITIPPDHFFMMGDNRDESEDSRYWGPVPKKWIIGNAFATYWPPKKIGTL